MKQSEQPVTYHKYKQYHKTGKYFGKYIKYKGTSQSLRKQKTQ